MGKKEKMITMRIHVPNPSHMRNVARKKMMMIASKVGHPLRVATGVTCLYSLQEHNQSTNKGYLQIAKTSSSSGYQKHILFIH